MISLRLPTRLDEEQIMSYRNEFIENNEKIDGSAGLHLAKDFNTWYEDICANRNECTLRDGFVQSYTYIAFDDENKNYIVGMVDMRQRLNNYLLQFGGHIGYSVRNSQRNKGYATEMIQIAIRIYKRHKINSILITCDKENIASRKVIEKNGGILENEILYNGNSLLRYWITL